MILLRCTAIVSLEGRIYYMFFTYTIFPVNSLLELSCLYLSYSQG